MDLEFNLEVSLNNTDYDDLVPLTATLWILPFNNDEGPHLTVHSTINAKFPDQTYHGIYNQMP